MNILKKLKRRRDDQVRSQIRQALAGQTVQQAGRCRIYQWMGPEETAVIVQDPGQRHKYIIAEAASGRTYVAVMPLTLISLHKHILAELSTARGENFSCLGGGYLEFKDGRLELYGASQDFGPADHEYAHSVLRKAVS